MLATEPSYKLPRSERVKKTETKTNVVTLLSRQIDIVKNFETLASKTNLSLNLF